MKICHKLNMAFRVIWQKVHYSVICIETIRYAYEEKMKFSITCINAKT